MTGSCSCVLVRSLVVYEPCSAVTDGVCAIHVALQQCLMRQRNRRFVGRVAEITVNFGNVSDCVQKHSASIILSITARTIYSKADVDVPV